MKQMKTLLRWLLAIACLAYLVKFFYDSRADLSIALSLDGWVLTGIVAMQLLYYFLQGERLRIVMEKCSGRNLPVGPWLKLFIIGRFLNTIFAQAGNVSRGVILKRDYGVSYTRYIAANASMAWMDTGMNFLLVAAIVLIFSPEFRIGPFAAWKVLGLSAVATIAGPVVFEAVFRRLRFGFGPLVWLHNKSAEVLRVSVENLADRMYLLKIVLLGLAVFARTVLIVSPVLSDPRHTTGFCGAGGVLCLLEAELLHQPHPRKPRHTGNPLGCAGRADGHRHGPGRAGLGPGPRVQHRRDPSPRCGYSAAGTCSENAANCPHRTATPRAGRRIDRPSDTIARRPVMLAKIISLRNIGPDRWAVPIRSKSASKRRTIELSASQDICIITGNYKSPSSRSISAASVCRSGCLRPRHRSMAATATELMRADLRRFGKAS